MFSGCRVGSDGSDSILERLELAARERPDHPALSDGTASLTYQEATGVISAVASALRGIASNSSRVGMLVDREVHAPLGVLAVLWAGMTCVVLEAEQPDGLLSRIAADAGVSVVLHPLGLKEQAERISKGRPLVGFDATETTRSSCPPASPAFEQHVCLLFVAGATGRPQGIVHTWQSCTANAAAYVRAVSLNSDDVVGTTSAPGSSAFLVCLLGTVLAGATLDMAGLHPPSQAPHDAPGHRAVTVLHTLPRLLHGHLSTQDTSRSLLAGVRTVVLGGERIEPNHLGPIRDTFAHAAIISMYGTSECPIALTHRHDSSETDVTALPVGYPTAGVEVRLVNQDHEPVEETGQIALTGERVALGYWSRANADAAPFDAEGTRQRTYFTGDVAWRRPDGALVLTEREDRQLKIAGRRVEPDEIETRLRSHPSVAQAAVTGDGTDSSPLLAHVTTVVVHTGEAPDLSAFLRRQLPVWSLPSRVVVLDTFPVGPDGEVDRELLRDREPVATDSGAPATDVEREVRHVWSEVLLRPDPGLNQHFVRAGGDSLQLVRMISLVNERFDTNLELLDVLRQPTVRAIANLVERHRTSGL